MRSSAIDCIFVILSRIWISSLLLFSLKFSICCLPSFVILSASVSAFFVMRVASLFAASSMIFDFGLKIK